MRQINLRVPEELLARIDAAAGDVPRERWLRRAVEQALGDEGDCTGEGPGDGARTYGSAVGSTVGTGSTIPSEAARIGRAEPRGRAVSPTPPSAPDSPAPAEQPVYRQHVPGPDVENIRSSGAAKRDVRPVPKRGA